MFRDILSYNMFSTAEILVGQLPLILSLVLPKTVNNPAITIPSKMCDKCSRSIVFWIKYHLCDQSSMKIE